MAAATEEETLVDTFLSMAQDEAKHKLRFEVEYDDLISSELLAFVQNRVILYTWRRFSYALLVVFFEVMQLVIGPILFAVQHIA